ncbi:hypothetical protein Tco_1125164 [Tanacetum coccineum]|uniref:Reverse transcriptase Ty1/copia-type domain-containing protein n=1 Tax=Tanacetum coccineum TaxID=301880 RepID=A0ABQ5J8Q0_9ASTR
MANSRSTERVEAMNNEIQALNRNNTWTITKLLVERKPIGFYMDDIVITGNDQYEIDSFKTFIALLHQFGLLAAKPVATPLPENCVLSSQESETDKL